MYTCKAGKLLKLFSETLTILLAFFIVSSVMKSSASSCQRRHHDQLLTEYLCMKKCKEFNNIIIDADLVDSVFLIGNVTEIYAYLQ